MNEPEVFQLAELALRRVVAHITEDQWSMAMPPNFTLRSSDQIPSLRDVINYHVYDDAWVPDMLAGRTMAEAGADKFDGDLLGSDPLAAFDAVVDAACEAARSVTELDAIVHLSFGDYTVAEYFWQINSFRALRAYDLAHVIGVDPQIPEALVQGVWDEVSPHAEEWRSLGVFPAAVPVPTDAPLLQRLAGLTGRDPAVH